MSRRGCAWVRRSERAGALDIGGLGQVVTSRHPVINRAALSRIIVAARFRRRPDSCRNGGRATAGPRRDRGRGERSR
jgi:hypothetical protein